MSIGPTELIIILVIVLILFGAGRLPQVLGQIGKGLREMREATEDSRTAAPNSNEEPAPTAQQPKIPKS